MKKDDERRKKIPPQHKGKSQLLEMQSLWSEILDTEEKHLAPVVLH